MRIRTSPSLSILCICALLFSCVSSRTGQGNGRTRSLMIMSINDVYRINGVYEGKEGGLARVRTLRRELERKYPDMICLHAGDFLFPSLLSGTYNGKQMISILNLMDGQEGHYDDRFFVVFGNHEFEKARMKDTTLLEELVSASEFQWFGTNVEFARNANCTPVVTSDNIIPYTLISSGGIRVGMFGLTTNVKHPAYVTTFADPVETARKMTALLRKQGAEVVVALTHLNVSEDKQILESLGIAGPDLILGGHEHDEQSHLVNGRYVLKANADATSAVVAKITLHENMVPGVTYEFRKISGDMAPDAVVQEKVEWWQKQYDMDYCKANNLPSGCTEEKYAFAATDLIAEEIAIRKYETNMGNWVADQMLNAFADQGAQIAFINSGSIRLNQNILKGDEILRRHINEMFPYQNRLKLIKITGADLQKILDRSVNNWAGNGWWLQIAGFAFVHDPDKESAGNLTLLTKEGPRTIQPSDTLLAVTTDYLLDPSGDQDGYTMLTQQMLVPGIDSPELTEVVTIELKKNLNTGIAPQKEGRICNTQLQEPCKAIR